MYPNILEFGELVDAPTTVDAPAVLIINEFPDTLTVVLPSINEFEPDKYNLLYGAEVDPKLYRLPALGTTLLVVKSEFKI